jgi:hypothetical protein
VPLGYTGMRMGTVLWLPRHVRFQYAAGALFTDRENSWNQLVAQVSVDGGRKWQQIDPDEMSEVQLAGYRNRIDRLVSLVRGTRLEEQVLSRLAVRVISVHGGTSAENAAINTVRFTNTVWPSGAPEMTQPEGHWKMPKLDSVPSNRQWSIATVRIENGRAVKVEMSRRQRSKRRENSRSQLVKGRQSSVQSSSERKTSIPPASRTLRPAEGSIGIPKRTLPPKKVDIPVKPK